MRCKSRAVRAGAGGGGGVHSVAGGGVGGGGVVRAMVHGITGGRNRHHFATAGKVWRGTRELLRIHIPCGAGELNNQVIKNVSH